MIKMNNTANLITHRVETICIDGKKYKTVTRNGLAMIPFTEVLIDYQTESTSGEAYAYYLCKFLRFLEQEFEILFLADVKKQHIAEFYKYLQQEYRERFAADEYDEEKKLSNATLKKYSFLLDAVFDALYDGDYEIDKSLMPLPRTKRNKYSSGHATTAGETLRSKLSYKQKNGKRPMETYTKWFSDEEIQAICDTANQRDKCIFQIGIETGYRISSILSIKNVAGNIAECVVEETFSKTGLLHAASISPALTDDIMRYITGERADIVADVGFDCGALFLTAKGKNKGHPLTRDAYYRRLEGIQKDVLRRYPHMQNLVLHSHACRSTFLDRLVRQNDLARAEGRTPIPDATICYLMDWASMDNLYDYYNYHRARNPVPQAAQDFEQKLIRRDSNDNQRYTSAGA